MRASRARSSGASTMSETLRRTILDSGQTLYRVSKDSGVSYATLHRFVTGQRAVSMAALDKLCAYLGLKLTR
jgi:transcriptional regulator with XRE-family HTH domain